MGVSSTILGLSSLRCTPVPVIDLTCSDIRDIRREACTLPAETESITAVMGISEEATGADISRDLVESRLPVLEFLLKSLLRRYIVGGDDVFDARISSSVSVGIGGTGGIFPGLLIHGGRPSPLIFLS